MDTEQQAQQFIENLIQEKGFPADLAEEVKDELRKDIARRLDNFISARIIAALSEENVKLFTNMLQEQKPEEEVQKFIQSNISNFQEFLTNVLLEFRDVYLGNIAVASSSEEDKSLATPS